MAHLETLLNQSWILNAPPLRGTLPKTDALAFGITKQAGLLAPNKRFQSLVSEEEWLKKWEVALYARRLALEKIEDSLDIEDTANEERMSDSEIAIEKIEVREADLLHAQRNILGLQERIRRLTKEVTTLEQEERDSLAKTILDQEEKMDNSLRPDKLGRLQVDSLSKILIISDKRVPLNTPPELLRHRPVLVLEHSLARPALEGRLAPLSKLDPLVNRGDKDLSSVGSLNPPMRPFHPINANMTLTASNTGTVIKPSFSDRTDTFLPRTLEPTSPMSLAALLRDIPLRLGSSPTKSTRSVSPVDHTPVEKPVALITPVTMATNSKFVRSYKKIRDQGTIPARSHVCLLS